VFPHLSVLFTKAELPTRSPFANHTQGGLLLFSNPLLRAERTSEVAAVSGVYRGEPGGYQSSPGIPQTNLSLSSTAALDRPPGPGQKPTLKNQLLGYLDCIEKSTLSQHELASKLLSKKCGLWSKIGQCENGHRFAVQLFCGKPWCELCRDIIHHRKIASLLPKAQQLLPAGSWVIRPPNEIQPLFQPRLARRRFIKAVIKALKSLGYRRGLVFTHYFGDDPTKYAFHLQVLVGGGWLEPEPLDDLKRKLRRLIYSKRIVDRWGDKLDINYHFKPTQGQVYQALEYCTRPTFTQFDGNERLADSIKGEHTIRRWGSWDEAPKWQLAESNKKLQSLVSLEQGKCPTCGKPITWGKRVIPFVLVLMEEPVEIAAGYYQLPEIRPPPAGRLDLTNLKELPAGDHRKQSNLVKRHGERAASVLSQLNYRSSNQ